MTGIKVLQRFLTSLEGIYTSKYLSIVCTRTATTHTSKTTKDVAAALSSFSGKAAMKLSLPLPWSTYHTLLWSSADSEGTLWSTPKEKNG